MPPALATICDSCGRTFAGSGPLEPTHLLIGSRLIRDMDDHMLTVTIDRKLCAVCARKTHRVDIGLKSLPHSGGGERYFELFSAMQQALSEVTVLTYATPLARPAKRTAAAHGCQ